MGFSDDNRTLLCATLTSIVVFSSSFVLSKEKSAPIPLNSKIKFKLSLACFSGSSCQRSTTNILLLCWANRSNHVAPASNASVVLYSCVSMEKQSANGRFAYCHGFTNSTRRPFRVTSRSLNRSFSTMKANPPKLVTGSLKFNVTLHLRASSLSMDFTNALKIFVFNNGMKLHPLPPIWNAFWLPSSISATFSSVEVCIIVLAGTACVNSYGISICAKSSSTSAFRRSSSPSAIYS